MLFTRRNWTLLAGSCLVAVFEANPAIFYIATATGGLEALRVDLPKALAEANAVLGRVPEMRPTAADGS